MADLDFLERSNPVQIVGGDELFPADVLDRKELEVTDGIKQEIINGALTVGTTAVEIKVGANRKVLRKGFVLYNNSNRGMYWGGSGVTVSNGMPLNKGETIVIRAEDVAVFVISDQANQDARVGEF